MTKQKLVPHISAQVAVLLFRRVRQKREPAKFRSKFIADATHKAFDLFAEHLAGKAMDTYHVIHGAKRKYYWARIEVVCISEEGAIPPLFARNAGGLLKARII